MMTERQPSTDSVMNNHESAKLWDVFCMPNYLNERTDGPAVKDFSKTFNAGTEKQYHFTTAGWVLLQISRKGSMKLSEEVYHFLNLLVLISFNYFNGLPTLRECKTDFEFSVRDKLNGIKMMPDLIISTDCAGVDKRNQTFRKEVGEALQKDYFFSERRKFYHAFSPAKTLQWSYFNTRPKQKPDEYQICCF